MEMKVRIINVYCPTEETQRNEFLDSLWEYANSSRVIWLAGDFNFMIDVNIDRVTKQYLPATRGTQAPHLTSCRVFEPFQKAT